MPPRCLRTCEIVVLKDALNSCSQDARGLARKLHLSWETALPRRLKSILVGGVHISKAALHGAALNARYASLLTMLPAYRSLVRVWRRRLTRGFGSTPPSWEMSSHCALFAFSPNTCFSPRSARRNPPEVWGAFPASRIAVFRKPCGLQMDPGGE